MIRGTDDSRTDSNFVRVIGGQSDGANFSTRSCGLEGCGAWTGNGKRQWSRRTKQFNFFRKGVFERRYEMKKNILVLVCLGILLVLPNLVLADCADIGGFTSFSVTAGNTVTLYSMNTPFVRFDVQCSIQSTSRLQLIKGYMCDGDEVLVDGSRCTILNVNSSID